MAGMASEDLIDDHPISPSVSLFNRVHLEGFREQWQYYTWTIAFGNKGGQSFSLGRWKVLEGLGVL